MAPLVVQEALLVEEMDKGTVMDMDMEMDWGKIQAKGWYRKELVRM